MFEVLRNYFKNKINLADDQFDYMCSLFYLQDFKEGRIFAAGRLDCKLWIFGDFRVYAQLHY
ncbi:MAG: hypothetical protein ABIO46_09470 [Chitinophagales bacterium]